MHTPKMTTNNETNNNEDTTATPFIDELKKKKTDSEGGDDDNQAELNSNSPDQVMKNSGSSTFRNLFALKSKNQQNISTPKMAARPSLGVINRLNFLKRKAHDIKMTSEMRVKIKAALDRVKIKLRAFQIFKDISTEIRTFGTSANLFDLTTRDRSRVKQYLYPLSEEFYGPNRKKADDTVPFPLIHPRSKIKVFWTPLISIILIYTATIMPYRLVFYDADRDYSDPWSILELCIDIIYWVDLFVNFLSTDYDEEGVLIRDRKKVILGYLTGWFMIDFIACLPFDEIGNAMQDDGGSANQAKKIQLVRLSKLPRLYRLIKITKIMKVFKVLSKENLILDYFDFNSGIMRLITLLISVMLLIHIMGCLWYYEALMDDFGPETWVYRLDQPDKEEFSLYLTSIYYALTTLATVGYGDIHAKTNTETITSIIWMLFGVGFYSFTIGTLSSVLSFIDTKSTILQRKIAIMNEFCNEMKISRHLKEKLRQTLEQNFQRNAFIWAEKTNIFNDLPINLRYEIVMNVHDRVISELLFFRNCEDKFFVVRIFPLLKPLVLKAKEEVWATGNNPDAIYFLVKGRVNFLKVLKTNKKTVKSEIDSLDALAAPKEKKAGPKL